MMCADHNLKTSPAQLLTQPHHHRSSEKTRDKYALNIRESEIDLNRNKMSVPSSNKMHSNSKLDTRSGPLKNKREPDLNMYLRSNYRKDFVSETRRKYDSFTKNSNSRHNHQSSNHNNSHINDSGLSEGTIQLTQEKSNHIRQTQGSLSKDKRVPNLSRHRYLRKPPPQENGMNIFAKYSAEKERRERIAVHHPYINIRAERD